ncbi:BRO family protein [Azotobacter beijerinckii]|uniref:BRO family, N-terminal domain n=1 Tax=Azotobacter beijerinckii TaxID=170623 RepID=A0A1I4EXF3_9GAMM|nr:BRO family protein [Azotobacter beijerinckii]SFB48602.1 BRO family, N-terminal domain [Azotobacter beijerinckii]SFL09770.1 BRO family, N-terminal domain [Azotobacter beijerinckii]
MQALTFRNTQFDITDRNGQPWLRGYQVGTALGYSDPGKKLHELYTRHADEFTDSMTALVKLPELNPQTGDAGQVREIRIFSLRGVHLLAMLSRTKVAKEFRRWVLDVLDGLSAHNSAPIGSATPAEPIHLTYNDRPFRIVPEGAALWFVTADVVHALGMHDAYRITRHLRFEHRSKRQVGRQMLNVIDRRGLDIALLHARPEHAEPLRLWLEAALEQFVPVAAPRALPGGLSGEQQGALKALVAARIEALPEVARGKAATVCWSALKSKFGCGYMEIAPERFSEAVSLVAHLALEGEWLKKEERKDGTVLTGEDMALLYRFCADAMDLVQIGERLRPALEGLHSIVLANVPADLESCRTVIGHLYRRFGQRMEEEARKYNVYIDWINLAAAEDRSQPIHRMG